VEITQYELSVGRASIYPDLLSYTDETNRFPEGCIRRIIFQQSSRALMCTSPFMIDYFPIGHSIIFEIVSTVRSFGLSDRVQGSSVSRHDDMIFLFFNSQQKRVARSVAFCCIILHCFFLKYHAPRAVMLRKCFRLHSDGRECSRAHAAIFKGSC